MSRVPSHPSSYGKLPGLAILIACCLTCVSCTDLALHPYRNDKLLENHRYALGEQYIEVNGLSLCYQEMGEGPTLVVLPGLATSIDYWQRVLPGLAEEHHVVALDPPGIGKSAKPADASYELPWLADHVVGFMDAMEIERATLVGASLGGHLALLIALDRPERVDRMVLMGACGSWPPPGPLLDLAIHILWNDVLFTDHIRRNWPTIFRTIVSSDHDAAQAIFEYQMAHRANREAFIPEGRSASRIMRSIFYNSCRGRVSEIDIPVLLVWGEFDEIHPLREGLYLRRHLPQSKLVIIHDAAHQVILDKPDVFNHVVRTFLREGLDAVPDDYEWILDRPEVHDPWWLD